MNLLLQSIIKDFTIKLFWFRLVLLDLGLFGFVQFFRFGSLLFCFVRFLLVSLGFVSLCFVDYKKPNEPVSLRPTIKPIIQKKNGLTKQI